MLCARASGAIFTLRTRVMKPGSWRAELLAFGESVRTGVTHGSVTSGADGLATVAAVEAVLMAVEEGGSVSPSFTL